MLFLSGFAIGQASLKESIGHKTSPYLSPSLPSFNNYYVYLPVPCLMKDAELEVPLGILCEKQHSSPWQIVSIFSFEFGLFVSVSLVISFISFMSFGNTSQFRFNYDSCFSVLCFIILF